MFDKNKPSAPVSATGADGYRVVETIRLVQQRAKMLAFGSEACNMTVGHNRTEGAEAVDIPPSSSEIGNSDKRKTLLNSRVFELLVETIRLELMTSTMST